MYNGSRKNNKQDKKLLQGEKMSIKELERFCKEKDKNILCKSGQFKGFVSDFYKGWLNSDSTTFKKVVLSLKKNTERFINGSVYYSQQNLRNFYILLLYNLTT